MARIETLQLIKSIIIRHIHSNGFFNTAISTHNLLSEVETKLEDHLNPRP